MNFTRSKYRRIFSHGIWVLAVSLAAAAPVAAQVNILTQHYDASRAGANLAETQLTASNVNVNSFGKIWTYTVSGSVYAQPLYVNGVSLPNVGVKNVVYVATMNDIVYAFDADSPSSLPLWSVNLTAEVPGSTPVPIVDIVQQNTLNIVGNVGIESTPVIDPSTGTLYLVARTKENGSYVQRLHALDITTGAEKFGGPTIISGSVPGTGTASSGGTLTFNPLIENQRSGLALANGQIYIGWASHEDMNPYHGWVMEYSASTLQQTAIWSDTPNGSAGGIWMSGWAPAVDSGGNIYYVTGNGTWDGSSNFGESILKLGATQSMPLLDWFTPDSWQALNTSDLDLGSSGLILVPGTNLGVMGTKTSIFYVVNTSNLGHEQTGDGQIVQTLDNNGGEIKGGPVYWNRSGGVGPWLYVWSNSDYTKAYHFNGSTFDTTLASEGTIKATSGESGGVLALSANGSTAGSGILWSSMPSDADGDHGVHPGILRASNADNLSQELWNSLQDAPRDDMGNWPKYSTPTIANGRVYMASFPADGVGIANVSVYGLLASSPPITDAPTFSLTPGSYASVQTVALADSTSGASIYYTQDGSIPTTSSQLYTGPITISTNVTINAVAVAPGQTNSAIASADYIVQSPISQAMWTLKYVDSQETQVGSYLALNAFDGEASTFWETQFYSATPPPPHEIQINLGAPYTMEGFSYLTRQDGCSNGTVKQYEFYVSTDGINWGTPVSAGIFNYGTANLGCGTTVYPPIPVQNISFPSTTGQYIRFRALSEVNSLAVTAAAELNVFYGAAAQAAPSALVLAPATLIAGASSTATVMMSAAVVGSATVVSLSSNSGAAIVPSSVTIPAGQTSATFTVSTPSGNGGAAVISASANGRAAISTLNVESSLAAIPAALTIAPPSVVAGSTATGTVTLNMPAPSDTIVTLASNNSVATVPASITIPAGQSTGSFSVSTTSGTGGSVSISASANGIAVSGPFTVGSSIIPVPATFITSPGALVSGTGASATVTLNSVSPLGGTVVALASNNPSVVVPASVTVPAGAISAGFNLTTLANDSGPITLTATANQGSAMDNILLLAPVSQAGWALEYVDSQQNWAAYLAPHAFDNDATTFWHTEWNPTNAPLPHDIQIKLGATYLISGLRYLPRQDGCDHGIIGQYEFYISNDGVNWGTPVSTGTFNYGPGFVYGCGGMPVVPEQVVTFPATTGSYIQLRALSEIGGGPWTSAAEINALYGSGVQAVPATLTLTPGTIIAGSNSTGTVSLNATVPTADTIVTLASNNLAATVPASITISAGQASASFAITTAAGSGASALISATANGATVSNTLTIDSSLAPVPSSLVFSPSSILAGASSTGTVSLDITSSTSTTIALSSNSAFVTIPASVTVPAGQTTASFTIATAAGSSGAVVISATANNSSISSTLAIQGIAVPSNLTFKSSTVISGSSGNATVFLNTIAPTGGLVVALATNNTSATVPTSVTVPAGSSQASFTITTTAGISGTAAISASADSTVVTNNFTFLAPVPKTAWSLEYVDSQETVLGPYLANYAFDGINSTFWQTEYNPTLVPMPHEIQINLGASYTLGGFSYLTRQDGCSNGTVSQYEFYVSTDGINWGTPVSAGTFNYGNTKLTCNSTRVWPPIQVISFAPVTGQYIRFRALSEVNSLSMTAAAEINALYGTAAQATPSAVMLSPSTVVAGANSAATVTIAAAVTSSATINLSSNSTSATVPSSVTIPAGQTSASFTVATTAGSGASALISATANGTTVNNTLTIQSSLAPVPSSLVFSPSSVLSGSGSTGTVSLDITSSTDTTVALSSNSASVTIPASVTVPAGQTSVSFAIATTNGSSGAVVISATANGTSINCSLTIQAIAVPANLTFKSSTVVSGSNGNETVTLNTPAPTGGLVVALTSNNASATVPASITVAAGSSQANFAVATTTGTSGTAVISASANGTTVTNSLTFLTPVPQTAWSLEYVDSQETVLGPYLATYSFDGSKSTFWQTEYNPTLAPMPHEIQINLGASYTLSGFSYLTRQDGCSNGTVSQYEFYVSTDGVNWGTPVSTGTFNYGNTPLTCNSTRVWPPVQVVSFPATTAQYIRFRALSEVNSLSMTSAAEINALH